MQREGELYRAIAKAIWLAAALAVALWFLNAIVLVLLVFAFTFILAIALNAPVTWLEQRRMHRSVATTLVCSAVAAIMALLGWIIFPRLIAEIPKLAASLPGYISRLLERFSRALAGYPEARQILHLDVHTFASIHLDFPALLLRVGGYTLSAFALLVIGIVIASTIIFILIQPRPLLMGYLSLIPAQMHDRAERAFVRGSQMVVGWIWSHVIIGLLEAVAVGIFLYLMGLPDALLWASFTFFAELVPEMGVYLMAVPPVLVALAIDPVKALWVILFYIGLSQFVGHFIAPAVRGRQMNLHPVSLIFAVLALGSAFGFMGVILSAPALGFFKAFYEEFHVAVLPNDTGRMDRIERMLARKLNDS